MIELEQTIEDSGVRFDCEGEAQEILYIREWLEYYRQEHKFWLTNKVPSKPHKTLTASVLFDEDVAHNLDRLGFASLFKLTFSKFELALPDASNTDSDFIKRLEALAEAVSNSEGVDVSLISVMKEEVGLK